MCVRCTAPQYSSNCCFHSNINSLYYFVFFFQAEDGIRDLVRSRGLGDVYKRQQQHRDTIGAELVDALLTADQSTEAGIQEQRGRVAQLKSLSLIHI